MKAARASICALALAGVVATLAPAAAADIVLRQKYPTEGAVTQVFVQNEDGSPVPGADVTVTYRPGSSVSHTEEVGVTGEGGRIEWTPATAGIAALHAKWEGGESSTNVSVKFAHVPAGGIIIMLLAGVLLVGGSVVRIMRVLKSPN